MIRQLRTIRKMRDSPTSACWHLLLGSILVLTAGAASSTSAQTDGVTITGGRQAENRQYWRWTITNNGTQPIVFMKFPHFLGDIFEYPKDLWNEEITNRNELGMDRTNGIFILNAKSAYRGIPPGQSLDIAIRVGRGDNFSVASTVIIKFADGETVEVLNVYCPQLQPIWERNILLFGMGSMFAMFVLYRYLKGRLRKSASPEARDPTTG